MRVHRHAILYVDDEVANLVALRYLLEDEYTVHTTAHPDEALAILEREDISVLLADQRMPRLSGAELCARARDVRPDTLRMIVTAYADLHAAIDAINRGQVNRYITKPYRNEDLLEILRTATDFVELQRTMRDVQLRLLQRGPQLGAARSGADELAPVLHGVAASLERMRDLIALTAASRLDANAAEALGRLRIENDHVLAVVNGLRYVVARPPPPGPPPEPPSADVARVVDGTVRLIRSELRGVGVRVVSEQTPVAAMDAAALGQIVTNLLLAAAEPPPATGQPAPAIALYIDTTATDALLRLERTSVGEHALDPQRAFDPSFDPARERSSFALAVARSLLAEAGGDVTLEVRPGELAFRVRMPLVGNVISKTQNM